MIEIYGSMSGCIKKDKRWLPSKELLSEVLKLEVTEVKGIEDTNTHLYLVYLNNDVAKLGAIHLNILESKCKKWARQPDLYINIMSYGKGTKFHICECDMLDNNTFESDKEWEAVTKACEWLYKEIKENQVEVLDEA